MSTHAEAALRASAPEAYTVLDDEDRIVHLSAPYRDTRGRSVGHVFWDHLPHAREVYEPHFAEARSTGRAVEAVVFYAGRLKRLLVIPGRDGLAVHVENLVELDVTSLETLTRTLAQVDAVLADRASARPDRRSRGSLRALP